MQYISKIGLALAGAFLLISAALILSQGLFGESFIALQLGVPWVFVLAYFEFFNPQSTALLATLLLIPVALNALVLYYAGVLLEWGYNAWAQH